MAKKKQAGRRVEGWKAKSWYKVYAPDNLNKAYIGDTISSDAENVVGRVIQTTLGEIFQDYAKQHVKVKLRIANVAGDAAYTEFMGHELSRDYLRSMVKRRSSRIDCQVPYTGKDGRRVRLTVTCFTISRANLSQTHEIRRMISEHVLKQVTAGDVPTLVSTIVSGELSKDLFRLVKPVYPVRRVEIIKSKVEPVPVAPVTG
jgi:small subunit ribosomal protein S3Ae